MQRSHELGAAGQMKRPGQSDTARTRQACHLVLRGKTEITKQVIEAGMTVGTHTWSHKDLARNPYAQDVELAKREIEMGVSAVHMAAGGGKVAAFFRFPDLQHPPQLMS
jgi:Polysaccharide deacetylase